MTNKLGTEQRITNLLRQFSKETFLDYHNRVENILEQCNNLKKYSKIQVMKTPNQVENIAITIKFAHPTFILLSHDICRFRSINDYEISKGKINTSRGIIPVFFSSINEMTALQLWAERVERFFDPQNNPFANDDVICWKITESSVPSDYSSMNFIRQNKSDLEPAEERLTKIYKKYFKFFYWSFPTNGFSSSTYFLHGEVANIIPIKTIKSLFIIDDVTDESSKLNISRNDIDTKLIHIRVLVKKDDDKYCFEKFSVFADTQIINGFDKKNFGTTPINGIISQIYKKDDLEQLMMTTIIDDNDKSYLDIISLLIGMISYNKYFDTLLLSQVSDIGDVNKLKQDVYDLYDYIQKTIGLEDTPTDNTNVFDQAIKELFPILFLTDENRVMVVHPLIWGFLQKWNLISGNDDEQRTILLNLFPIMDFDSMITRAEINRSINIDYFKKRGTITSNAREFINSVKELKESIQICKIMLLPPP